MTYKPYSLASLLQEKNSRLFLPHIQRPFVWEWDQVTRLIDSLMKGYPIQTFLFWRTTDAIKVRRFMDDVVHGSDLNKYYDEGASAEGKLKVCVLDGQQRLQSLFAAFDGAFDGEDLYINILDGEDEMDNGLSYRFEKARSPLDAGFFRMKSLTDDRRRAEDIAEDMSAKLSAALIETPEEKARRERNVRHNVSQLVSILREEKHIWVEELDGTATDAFPYDRVLQVFARVNSGGTRLDARDFLAAEMKRPWEGIQDSLTAPVEGEA